MKGKAEFHARYKSGMRPRNEKKLAKRFKILIILFGIQVIVCLTFHFYTDTFSYVLFGIFVAVDIVLSLVIMGLDILEV
ncbi:hypothetical protein QS257_17805 [Terrilactibacillus sp. S3-3]|nr:hypothetical protein QS257_17805 [Terrilactibacillus sp. S3-3]